MIEKKKAPRFSKQDAPSRVYNAHKAKGLSDRAIKTAQATSQKPRSPRFKEPEKGNVKPLYKKPWFIATSVLTSLLCLVLVGFWWVTESLNSSIQIQDEKERVELKEELAQPKEMKEPFYVLLLGSDARKGETQSRSDVIILARIDIANHTLSMMSIPRDTAVELPGYGVQKINAAMAYEGPAGAVRCVKAFTGVDISHYVMVNFDNVVDIVDSLGGVDLYVPQGFTTAYTDQATQGQHVQVQEGEVHLNGRQALAFARERKQVQGGDFARAQAQRTVIKAIIQKILNQPVTKLPELVTSLAQSMQTDMSIMEIAQLAQAFHAPNAQIYSSVVPSYAKFMYGASYVCTMYDEYYRLMQALDSGLNPNKPHTEAEITTSNKNAGKPTNAASPVDYYAEAQSAMSTNDVLPDDPNVTDSPSDTTN